MKALFLIGVCIVSLSAFAESIQQDTDGFIKNTELSEKEIQQVEKSLPDYQEKQ